ILSGALDDGTAGLLAVSNAGGLTLVQEPSEALYDAMPRSALEHVAVDVVASVEELGRIVTKVAGQAVALAPPLRPQPLELPLPGRVEAEPSGPPARFTCPDCGGSLWDVSDDGPPRFECRVGHSWSEMALIERQSVIMENALWTALRSLSERADL